MVAEADDSFAGMSLELYVEVGALLRFFPRDQKDAVLRAVGVEPQTWDSARSAWTGKVSNGSDPSLLGRWTSAFEAAWERVQRERPQLEALRPLDPAKLQAAARAATPAPAPAITPMAITSPPASQPMSQPAASQPMSGSPLANPVMSQPVFPHGPSAVPLPPPSSQGGHIPSVRRPMKAPATLAATTTHPGGMVHPATVLPFFKDGTTPAPDAGPISPRPKNPLAGATMAFTGPISDPQTLPFERAPGTASVARPHTPQGLPTPTQSPQPTIEQYASVCVELRVYPERRALTLTKYGYPDEGAFARTELAWQSAFAKDVNLLSRWNSLCGQYYDWLMKR